MKLELQFGVVYYLFYGLSKITLVVSKEGQTVQPTLILLLFLRAILLLLTWLYVVRIHNCNLVRAVKFFQIKLFSIPWTGLKWESFVILTLCEKQFFARLVKVKRSASFPDFPSSLHCCEELTYTTQILKIAIDLCWSQLLAFYPLQVKKLLHFSLFHQVVQF